MPGNGSSDSVVHDLVIFRVHVHPVKVEPHRLLDLVREFPGHVLLVLVHVENLQIQFNKKGHALMTSHLSWDFHPQTLLRITFSKEPS